VLLHPVTMSVTIVQASVASRKAARWAS
jgi:hypothetical protein